VASTGKSDWWSASRIDRLGQQLKRGPVTAVLIRELDSYRRTHEAPYFAVSSIVRADIEGSRTQVGAYQMSGRVGKSTTATVAKLRRQSVRLSQIQDMAGLRIIVGNLERQDTVLRILQARMPLAKVFDRRVTTSYGYRAVHMTATLDARSVELQIRTVLQHVWAQLSEKLSDLLRAPDIKYGIYPEDYPDVGPLLTDASRVIATLESEGSGRHSPRRNTQRQAAFLSRLRMALAVLDT
jgi:putative GTP pyrophosphokinase